MGFFDSIQDAMNRGTAAAGRTGRTVQIRHQLNELSRQRRDFMTQLGASLYESVKDNEELRAGREALLDGIAAVDQQYADLTAELSAIEAEAAASSGNGAGILLRKVRRSLSTISVIFSLRIWEAITISIPGHVSPPTRS